MMKKLKYMLSFLLLLLISCDKEVFTGIVETPEIELNKFFVDSEPKGLKIFFDNKNMGILTPDTVRWLKKGIHKLTLKGEFYLHDTTQNVDVKENIVNTSFIDLSNNPKFLGVISCSSQPNNAKIYLNDVYSGFTTPKIINNVQPGNYEIKFIRDFCREDSISIKVKGGEFKDVFFRLEDTTRSVSYRTVNSKIPSNALKKIVIDQKNNKWIGFLNAGLYRYDDKNWTAFDNFGKLSDAHITDLLIDRKGQIWISSTTSLTMYDGINWHELSSHLPSNIVNALEEDLDGNIWIGTFGGLVKYSNSIYEVFTTQNSQMPENNVLAISTLKDCSIAIGFSQTGIMIKKGSSWISHNIAAILSEDKISGFVTDIIEDNNNIIWAFVLGDPVQRTRSAIVRYLNGSWIKFNVPLQFPVEVVSFHLDSSNNLWMACKEGLVKYNQTQGAKIFNNIDYNFFGKHCTSVHVDKNGDVWTTTLDGGLVKIKKGNY